MIVQEPSSLEVFLTLAVGNLFSGFFKEYVDRLDLKGDERILELGPSAGNHSRFLARKLLRGGGCLTAVDISSVWVDVARNRLRQFPNVDVQLGDIASLDIPNGSQDAVLISFVLHDIPRGERERVTQATLDKLKPGGKLFVREPLRDITPDDIQRLLHALGLAEISSTLGEVRTQGMIFEGVYVKVPFQGFP